MLALLLGSSPSDFRVLPHLLAPHRDSMIVNWHTEEGERGELTLIGPGGTKVFVSQPRLMPILGYSELEEKERGSFPDMFQNRNFKHQVKLSGLQPNTIYRYAVRQGGSQHRGEFRTPPTPKGERPIRLTVFADSETDPEGRTTFRDWSIGTQDPASTGRPAAQTKYLVTETQGFIENLKMIRSRKPDLMLLAGDIVQGGGYQRAWDEFFFHMAGKFDDPISSIPLIPAIGNWENFGARVGGYEPWAIANARRKYSAYFDAPSNGSRDHQNFYHRIDFGPITVVTLDSSNGLPDNTDNDTNKNIDAAKYPGRDLVDCAPGSRQWEWCLRELASARKAGQVIFVQFHHIPYSGGGHSLPTSLADSSGQSGLTMRAYTPWFQKYGVAAVFCGHNESFEWSAVGDVQFFDAGVAGDGLGSPVDDRDPRRFNPWRKWVAHFDEKELWNGPQLVRGGKHYGHLEVDVEKRGSAWMVTYTPVHSFPVTNERGEVIRFERRVAGKLWSHYPGAVEAPLVEGGAARRP